MTNSPVETCLDAQETGPLVLGKFLLRDASLSFGARGLLTYFLSYGEGWKLDRKEIIKTQNISRYSLAKLIDELIERGYLQMNRFQDERGYWNIEYYISQSPTFKKVL